MKKFFTLLFCVVTMSLAANANEPTLVDRCINVLLGQTQNTMLMTPNLDANHDGMISIIDATMLIDQALEAQQVQKAPAQQQPEAKVEAIIDEALQTTTGQPDIEDVSKAIDKKIKKK